MFSCKSQFVKMGTRGLRQLQGEATCVRSLKAPRATRHLHELDSPKRQAAHAREACPRFGRRASGRYLSFADREKIALLRAKDGGIRQVARRLGRSSSTYQESCRRNAATRAGKLEYRATAAQWHRDRRASRPNSASWRATTSSATTSRSDSAGGLPDTPADSSLAPTRPSRAAATAVASTPLTRFWSRADREQVAD